ncbi:MAG: OmpA family protein, partial [Bacteroidia bacterium]
IQSHTDSKGSDQYNEKLSQKRAESVVNYLIGKGINPLRLKAKGYGESKPIAPNENSDGSDNPEGRAQNRRTDFKIIGTLDVEILNSGSDAED